MPKTTKKQTTKRAGKKGGSAMMASAAGAVVGAAIGGAAAAALANKNTRQKMTKAVSSVSGLAADALESVDQAGYDMHGEATEQLHKVTKPVKRNAKQQKAN